MTIKQHKFIQSYNMTLVGGCWWSFKATVIFHWLAAFLALCKAFMTPWQTQNFMPLSNLQHLKKFCEKLFHLHTELVTSTFYLMELISNRRTHKNIFSWQLVGVTAINKPLISWEVMFKTVLPDVRLYDKQTSWDFLITPRIITEILYSISN